MLKFEKKHLIRAAILASVVAISIGTFGAFMSRKIVANVDYNELLIQLDMDTQDDLDQRRNERDQALGQAQQAQARVNELAGQREELSGELEYLNGLSEEQREQYDIISAQYAAALVAKAEALDSYVRAQDNLAESKEAFKRRIAIMFEFQDKSYMEVLLESDSIAGFFTNMEIISLIAESDAQAIQDLQTAVADAELQADLALREADDMERIAAEKLAQLEELESRIGVTEAALEDVSTDIAYWEQQEMELEIYAESLNSQIASLQQQIYLEQQATATTAAATTTTEETTVATNPEPVVPSDTEATEPSDTDATESVVETTPEPTPEPTATPVPTQAPVVSNGSLSWPTWNHTITSYYGNRVHPVYGTVRFHSGIDIGAWYGDTIMAAASGTVIYVEEPVPGQDTGGSGYGNYCIIDHGNGLSTLYAHARDITVSYGDYVSAGQAIGVVGSTGTSTSAHLHFEVRVWGANTDPLGYLP